MGFTQFVLEDKGYILFISLNSLKRIFFCFFCFVFCLFAFSRAELEAHEGSQARGRIGAVATSLHQSHSNSGSEPCLRPTLQLTATSDP